MRYQHFLTPTGKVDIRKCRQHFNLQDRVWPFSYYLNNHAQPPKLIEAQFPDLQLSKDWVMPINDTPHQIEVLLHSIWYDEKLCRDLFYAFATLNPELEGIHPASGDHVTYLYGFTSAFNLEDIQEYVLLGGACDRGEQHRMRSRMASLGLGLSIQWVLSEKTLKQVEEYVVKISPPILTFSKQS